MAPAPAIAPAVAATRATALVATILLFVLCLAWELWLAPTGSRTLAVKALPLLLPLRGLARLHLYTYRWTSLGVWLYFAEGAVRATSDRGAGAPLGAAEAMLSLVVFAACAMHVRARLRAGKAAT